MLGKDEWGCDVEHLEYSRLAPFAGPFLGELVAQPEFHVRTRGTRLAYHTKLYGWRVSMTQLLEKAISAVSMLPEQDQDALAAILFEEMASEQRWSELFAQSQGALEKLAAKALAEHASGETKPL